MNDRPLFPVRERAFLYGLYGTQREWKGDVIRLER
jgi:hypothetical protein